VHPFADISMAHECAYAAAFADLLVNPVPLDEADFADPVPYVYPSHALQTRESLHHALSKHLPHEPLITHLTAHLADALGMPTSLPPVAVLLVGKSLSNSLLSQGGWQSMERHVLSVLDAERRNWSMFICTEDGWLPGHLHRRLRVKRILDSITPSAAARRAQCYREAIQRGQECFSHFISMRPDLSWHADIPSLLEMPFDAVSLRVRAMIGHVVLTSDQASWKGCGLIDGFGRPFCSDELAAFARGQTDKGCVILDDQLGIVPAQAAPAFFGPLPDQLQASSTSCTKQMSALFAASKTKPSQGLHLHWDSNQTAWTGLL
jgi:hypothetical protein